MDMQALSAFETEQHQNGRYTIVKLKNAFELSVVVPEGVEAIGDEAFRDSGILEITLPEGLLKIGDRAFMGCTDLDTVNFPSTLRVIGKEAFRDCVVLDVEVPARARVGEDAFLGTLRDKKTREQMEAEEEERRRINEEIAERKAERQRKQDEEREAAEAKRAEEARREEEERQTEERNAFRMRVLRPIAGASSFATVTFGSYPQTTATPTPIEWYVVTKEMGKALLLSKQVLFPYSLCSGYHWGETGLREYLNEDFLKEAFTPLEQQFIACDSRLSPYGKSDMAETKEQVFLLSSVEVEQYFKLLNKRFLPASPTQYAIREGAAVVKKRSLWWLRCRHTAVEPAKPTRITSPNGYTSYIAPRIGSTVTVHYYHDVDENGRVCQMDAKDIVGGLSAKIGVRPAIWVEYTGN
jgi:hypothetical protein